MALSTVYLCFLLSNSLLASCCEAPSSSLRRLSTLETRLVSPRPPDISWCWPWSLLSPFSIVLSRGVSENKPLATASNKIKERWKRCLQFFALVREKKQLNCCGDIFEGEFKVVISMSPHLSWSSFRPTLLLQELRPDNNEAYNEALPAFIHNYHIAINI